MNFSLHRLVTLPGDSKRWKKQEFGLKDANESTIKVKMWNESNFRQQKSGTRLCGFYAVAVVFSNCLGIDFPEPCCGIPNFRIIFLRARFIARAASATSLHHGKNQILTHQSYAIRRLTGEKFVSKNEFYLYPPYAY